MCFNGPPCYAYCATAITSVCICCKYGPVFSHMLVKVKNMLPFDISFNFKNSYTINQSVTKISKKILDFGITWLDSTFFRHKYIKRKQNAFLYPKIKILSWAKNFEFLIFVSPTFLILFIILFSSLLSTKMGHIEDATFLVEWKVEGMLHLWMNKQN